MTHGAFFLALVIMALPGVHLQDGGIIRNDAVSLQSTLKQRSLCPGEETATFTCSAEGTDLTWVVGGRMMSYNSNARFGDVRSNIESDETAILIRVDSTGEGGRAVRISVLSISARPAETEALTIQCHNGSAAFAVELSFWRRVAAVPSMPEITLMHQEADRVMLDWTTPGMRDDIQTVDYYSVQFDGARPMLVKNTSAILHIEDGIAEYSLVLRTFDRCAQRGEELVTPILINQSTETMEIHHSEHTTYSASSHMYITPTSVFSYAKDHRLHPAAIFAGITLILLCMLLT